MKKLFVIGLIYLAAGACLAQELAWKSLQQRFGKYRNQRLIEKLYVHTDQAVYLTGETIRFKVYCLEGTFHRPLALSKVAYIEIINARGASDLQAVVSLNERGTGEGWLHIPTSLASGNYVLRAYTRWMRNYDARFFYQEKLAIINPFIPLNLRQDRVEPSYDLQFFPEGGNMLLNADNTVAFRVADQQGKGVEVKGVILSDDNDTITTVSTLKFGLGRFQLKPLYQKNYKAMLRLPGGKLIEKELPRAIVSGFRMRVVEEDNMLKISTLTHDSFSTRRVYLLIHARQSVKVVKVATMNKGTADFMIDKASLGPGISHITIFDDQMKPVCERLFFNRNLGLLKLSVSSAGQHAPRDKVVLSVQSRIENVSSRSELSVSVYKVDSITNNSHIGIAEYLNLTSDLGDNIESPSYYLSENANPEQVDNLMLTQGWRRFNWDEITDEKAEYHPEFVPELNGRLVVGRATWKGSHKPATGVDIYVAVPGSAEFNVSRTDEEGNFFFEAHHRGEKEMIVQTEVQGTEVELVSSFAPVEPAISLSSLELPEDRAKSILARSVHMQVQNALTKFDEEDSETVPNRPDFYGPPDRLYRLDDYTRFPTVEEVLREYVPEVAVRRVKGSAKLLIYDPNDNSLFTEAPLTILDGVPIFDLDKFMTTDPKGIKTLEVITKKYYYTGLSFGGVVSFTTYHNDLGGFEIDTVLLRSNYENFKAKREFFNPKYATNSQQGSGRPDARTLLYFEPYFQIDDSGEGKLEFYAPDIPGNYRVNVQGITRDGQAGSATFHFEVIKP